MDVPVLKVTASEPSPRDGHAVGDAEMPINSDGICTHARTQVPPLVGGPFSAVAELRARIHIGSISASPTPCPFRGYGRAGTQNDRLSEAVILSTGTPVPAQ